MIATIARDLHTKTPEQQAVTLAALAVLGRQRSENPEGLISAAKAKEALASLKVFVHVFWHCVEADTPLVWNWHLDEMCKVLESITRGELQRVIFNVPPGTMKSLLVSVFWPAWEWARKPKLRYLTASYGSHLSIRDNLKVRDICQSLSYQTHYTLRFTGDQNAKELFNTKQRGWRFATSVGGAGTGEHPDRIIIDDPITAAASRSEVKREECRLWYKRTVASRGVARKARVVLIMQRLHVDDLAGYLLSLGGWHLVRFPMRYMAASQDGTYQPDPRDHRKKPGDLLWPSLFPEDAVKQLELDLDPYGVAGQLQQIPAPEGGGLFKRDWFTIVDIVPKELKRSARGWDTAGTDNGGDYTAGVKIGVLDGVYYVMDVVRGQWSSGAVDDVMRETAKADGAWTRQREEQEPGSSGKAVIAARRRLLAGFDYGPAPTTGDKVTRARAFRSQCEGRNVKIVRGPWNEAYIRELCDFPTGKHDDQVDGSSTAFNELAVWGPMPMKQANAGWG